MVFYCPSVSVVRFICYLNVSAFGYRAAELLSIRRFCSFFVIKNMAKLVGVLSVPFSLAQSLLVTVISSQPTAYICLTFQSTSLPFNTVCSLSISLNPRDFSLSRTIPIQCLKNFESWSIYRPLAKCCIQVSGNLRTCLFISTYGILPFLFPRRNMPRSENKERSFLLGRRHLKDLSFFPNHVSLRFLYVVHFCKNLWVIWEQIFIFFCV